MKAKIAVAILKPLFSLLLIWVSYKCFGFEATVLFWISGIFLNTTYLLEKRGLN